MARILVLNPFGATEPSALANLQRVADPATEFDIENLGDEYPLRNNQWYYFRHECIGLVIERVLMAEKRGYQAVFLSCQLDVGLYECRHLVEIPVTGTLESAALLAYQVGRRFSLLSVDRQNGEIQRMLLEMYGLAGRLASVRSFDIDAEDLYPDVTPPAEVTRRVLDVARKCIDEDQAEVLIPGCTLAGATITAAGAAGSLGAGERPLPIIDGMLAGFKLAEMWAALAAAGVPFASRLGFYEHPPEDQFRKLRSALNKPVDAAPGPVPAP